MISKRRKLNHWINKLLRCDTYCLREYVKGE